MKDSTAFIFVALLMCTLSFFKCSEEPETRDPVTIETPPIVNEIEDTITFSRPFNYLELLDTAILHMKDYEGFRSDPYKDVDGTWTIGYGHHMIDGYWKWNQSITETEADSMLRSDLNERIQDVNEEYDITGHKAISIALFIFNCGSGSFRGSTLRKLIEAGEPIDDEIVKWCHYTKDGTTIISPALKERREFELKIYNNELVKENI